MEIERKYLVKYIPKNLEQYEVKIIEQGYLSKKPIIRIRKSNNDYILTYKNKVKHSKSTALINEEIEMNLTKDAYEHLKKKIDNNLIIKKRYLIPIKDELIAELDIFEGNLTGLYFAEIEFPDIKTADNYILPEWMLKDISNDKRYGNYNLSKLDKYEEFFTIDSE